MLSCALLALQSDGVVGAASCVARGAAEPATERLTQTAGAHTAAIRMLPLPPQPAGVWSREPLAAHARDAASSDVPSAPTKITKSSLARERGRRMPAANLLTPCAFDISSATTKSTPAATTNTCLRAGQLTSGGRHSAPCKRTTESAPQYCGRSS
jgi:hypothetical protein